MMTLSDLYNPNHITALHHKKGHSIEKGEGQAWQEYPGSYELWQEMGGGRILRVQRWLKKSIIGVFRD